MGLLFLPEEKFTIFNKEIMLTPHKIPLLDNELSLHKITPLI